MGDRMISAGGSDIQYGYFKNHVRSSLQKEFKLHRIPNPESSSFYHLDDIDLTQINIAWTQQSYDMIESLNLSNQQELFDQIVCVSEWQKTMYVERLNCAKEKITVIPNGIIPIARHKKPTGKLNLIYTSTPYRGLDVLLQAFQYLQEDVRLHVFSSMQIYGQSDEPYEHLYDFCKKHTSITYYGSVPHAELIAALSEMHIFAYPSTFEETSCISVLEALSAELSVVCPNLGALEETTAGFANIYDYNHDKFQHAEIFASNLKDAINNYDQKKLFEQKQHIDKHHDWATVIKSKWENLITDNIRNKTPKLNILYS
jgi:glycosyltransferase involved in cell wall biosynthesis